MSHINKFDCCHRWQWHSGSVSGGIVSHWEQCLVASAVIGTEINNKQTGCVLARSIDASNLARECTERASGLVALAVVSCSGSSGHKQPCLGKLSIIGGECIECGASRMAETHR